MSYKQKKYIYFTTLNCLFQKANPLLAELLRNHFILSQRLLKIEIFIFRILLYRVFCSNFISSSIHNHIHIHMFFSPLDKRILV